MPPINKNLTQLTPATVLGPADLVYTVQGGGTLDRSATLAQMALFQNARNGVYNVLDYGIVGDGLTNDLPALTALLALVPSKSTVYFPALPYRIDGTLSITKVCTLIFEAGSRVNHTGVGVAVSMAGGLYGNVIKNLALYGTAATTDGLVMDKTHHGLYENVKVHDVSSVGLKVLAGVCNTFVNYRCSGNEEAWAVTPVTGLVLDNDGVIGHSAAANVFIQPIIEGVSGDGIILKEAIQTQILGGTSESNAGRGVLLEANATGNSLEGMDCEANGGDGFTVRGSGNSFLNVISLDPLRVSGGSNHNTFVAGRMHDVIIEAGAIEATFESVLYSTGGAGGTFTDGGVRTTLVNVTNANTASPLANQFPIINALNVGGLLNAPVGEIRASGGLRLDGVTQGRVEQRRLVVNTGTTAQLLNATGSGNDTIAKVSIINVSYADFATYYTLGPSTIATEQTDSSGNFTPTAGNPGTLNIYWSAGNNRYEVQNNRAANVTLCIFIEACA